MTDETSREEAFHLAGDRLGKYVILSELGRGSMGVVYEAFQSDLKRKVALKVLPANITLDGKQVQRFHREAESVARLRHDNVIQIYDVDEVENTHYFAMELVEGRPIEEEFGRDGEAITRAARAALRVFTFSNGSKYVGEFKDDNQDGQGTMTYSNGNKYVGEWKNNKQDGQGTMTYPDGTSKTGIWKDENLVKESK
jgi:hypothetical protein